VDKLRHVVLIEDGTGLFAVGMDVSNRDFGETDARHLDEFDIVVQDNSGVCFLPGGPGRINIHLGLSLYGRVRANGFGLLRILGDLGRTSILDGTRASTRSAAPGCGSLRHGLGSSGLHCVRSFLRVRFVEDRLVRLYGSDGFSRLARLREEEIHRARRSCSVTRSACGSGTWNECAKTATEPASLIAHG
jgi:hypothetical protein